MKCLTPDCSNEARYVNARGELCCAICPLKEGIDSIRIREIPLVLKYLRNMIQNDGRATYPWLCELIGREPRR